MVNGMLLRVLLLLLVLVATTRVGVVIHLRVAAKLVGTGELLAVAGGGVRGHFDAATVSLRMLCMELG